MGFRRITSNSSRVYNRGVLEMEYLIMGLIKIVDNMITTAKNIATYKNKKLESLKFAIQVFYYLTRSLTISPAIISPIADGTNERLPGIALPVSSSVTPLLRGSSFE